ncbi:MAG: ParB/RepB/Spo0J family partition protein [Actinobacteria bacterium]|nr:ParB/RepB/Spo0J family partition protein [Actinomycetota bacterium]
MAKRGLGRGLGALIPGIAGPQEGPEAGIVELPLEKVVPNRNQPRRYFDDESLEELTQSIKEFGVIQPIIVRRLDGEDKYEIIAGERRYRAAQKLGMSKIPSIINNDINDISSLEMALVENIHRKDLTPIELAHALKQLLEEFNLTHEELSRRVGKSRAAVTNYLRLLALPVEVQKMVDEGKLSMGHAKVIAGLKDYDEQVEIAKLVLKRDLNVRQTEKIISRQSSLQTRVKDSSVLPLSKLPELSRKISDYLNAPVKMKIGKKKGRIEIEFGSIKDLERIVYRIIG